MRSNVLAVLALTACAATTWAQEPIKVIQPGASNIADPASYGIGYDIGMQISQGGLQAEDLSKNDLLAGLIDALSGKEPAVQGAEVEAAMKVLGEKVMARAKEAAAAQLVKSNAYLEQNKKKDGVQTTDTGLQYKVVKSGNGASPTNADTVSVHYEGKLIDGTVFDSSIKRGEPAVFGVGQVIPGWTEALMRMKVGDKWQLFIPPSLAYGEAGSRGAIGPNEALIFDVELLEIKK